MGTHQIKNFCMAKENSIKMKREPTMWENIVANDTSDKGLISKIYKELTDSTPGRQTTQLVSIFCMYLSSFSNIIYWIGCLYSIVYFYPLCQILIDHKDMGLFLGSLFCSIDLCVCSSQYQTLLITVAFNVVWYHVLWSLLLCSFSKLLWLFRVTYCSK